MESDTQKRVFIWGDSAYQGFRLQGRSRNWLADLWTSDEHYQMLEGNRPYVDFEVSPDLSYNMNWGYQEWFWVNENKSNGMGDSRAWEARTSIRCVGRKVLVILPRGLQSNSSSTKTYKQRASVVPLIWLPPWLGLSSSASSSLHGLTLFPNDFSLSNFAMSIHAWSTCVSIPLIERLAGYHCSPSQM